MTKNIKILLISLAVIILGGGYYAYTQAGVYNNTPTFMNGVASSSPVYIGESLATTTSNGISLTRTDQLVIDFYFNATTSTSVSPNKRLTAYYSLEFSNGNGDWYPLSTTANFTGTSTNTVTLQEPTAAGTNTVARVTLTGLVGPFIRVKMWGSATSSAWFEVVKREFMN